MTDPISTAFSIAEAGVKLIGTIAILIDQALSGDNEAAEKLKRVEAVLSPKSPTESAFARASDIAAGKPSRDDEPTRETGGGT